MGVFTNEWQRSPPAARNPGKLLERNMSALVCSMSGEPPVEPVVSRKTGHMFEKRTILSYILETGTCPITNQPLTAEDLVEIKANRAVKPRPVTATSVPALISIFQGEWDAVINETLQLRKQLEATRQELSTTLYQHDAACRVIAKLIKERDEARTALANANLAQLAQNQAPPAAAPAPAAAAAPQRMEIETEKGITEAMKAGMTEKSSELSKGRKKREASAALASEADIANFKELSNHPVHKANPILCLDLHPTKDNLALTGGADNKVVLLDRSSGKAVATMSGHTKKITRVLFHPTEDFVFSASADKTVKVWKASTGAAQYTFKEHTTDVTGITVHATGDFIVTASSDKTWAFYDLATGTCRAHVADSAVTAGFSDTQFHPDGLILGTGTIDSMVRLWDIKSQHNVVTFSCHEGPINNIAFSENGYYLATSAQEGVKIWDLRKVAKAGAAATAVRHLGAGVGEALDVTFDFSGSYIAFAAGNSIKVHHTKSWEEVVSLDGHGGATTSVGFGPDARIIASTSKDRLLRFFG